MAREVDRHFLKKEDRSQRKKDARNLSIIPCPLAQPSWKKAVDTSVFCTEYSEHSTTCRKKEERGPLALSPIDVFPNSRPNANVTSHRNSSVSSQQLRCTGKDDCPDGSDERDCNMIFPDPDYNKIIVPPPARGENVLKVFVHPSILDKS